MFELMIDWFIVGFAASGALLGFLILAEYLRFTDDSFTVGDLLIILLFVGVGALLGFITGVAFVILVIVLTVDKRHIIRRNMKFLDYPLWKRKK